MPAIALIITDLERGRLGQARSLRDELAGASILEHTIRRAARIEGVSRLVLVHRADEDVSPLIAGLEPDKPIACFADPTGGLKPADLRRLAARKWAMTGWRGGLGSATCYDELLPAAPLVEAMKHHDADAAVIVGGDWCVFDPDYAGRQLKLHTDAPDAMKITFTQAPPGLGAIVTSRTVLEDFAEHDAGFGNALGYNPRKPVIDPIGRDVCLGIDPAVRDTFERFVCDTPRSAALLRAAAASLGDRFADAGIDQIAGAVADAAGQAEASGARRPSHIWLELTPRREVAGPITAQHCTTLDRPDMPTGDAIAVVQQIGRDLPGATLMIGHLGEPLRHDGLVRIIEAAHVAGVFAIGVETDLLCDEATLEQLAVLPLDVISVRLNADTGATYAEVMGVDRFSDAAKNLQRLFELIRQPGRAAPGGAVVRPSSPWVVPRLMKVKQNVREIESFFDRWVTIAGHAVIERFDTGGGLAVDLSPVPMDPPQPLRTPLDGRCAVILSDGRVTASRSDWLGTHAIGTIQNTGLAEIWQTRAAFAEAG